MAEIPGVNTEYLGPRLVTDEVQPKAVVNEIPGSPSDVHEFNLGALQEQYAQKLAGIALSDVEVRTAA